MSKPLSPTLEAPVQSTDDLLQSVVLENSDGALDELGTMTRADHYGVKLRAIRPSPDCMCCESLKARLGWPTHC
jgi:hypothetical protein